MEHVSSVRPTGKFSGKVENLKRYARFLGWNVLNGFRVPFTPFSYFYISFPTVTNSAAILVCRRVTGSAPYRDLRSNGTTCYLSEIPFFPHRNLIFQTFYLNGKRPKFYELITAQSRSTRHEKVKCNSSTKQ